MASCLMLPRRFSTRHSYIPLSSLPTSCSCKPLENLVNVVPKLGSWVLAPKMSVLNQVVQGWGKPFGTQLRKAVVPGAKSMLKGEIVIRGGSMWVSRGGDISVENWTMKYSLKDFWWILLYMDKKWSTGKLYYINNSKFQVPTFQYTEKLRILRLGMQPG